MVTTQKRKNEEGLLMKGRGLMALLPNFSREHNLQVKENRTIFLFLKYLGKKVEKESTETYHDLLPQSVSFPCHYW